ncbi:hypothetical protein OCC_02967 [Thermococcus litoralis DSM 5473]|uniref:Uncharacterized protein n=1 Tax=Thermococcus litoralis (strain ATCC 51850 / DSM 5473 / JCM 8560 / NS-C) TaxID=523849 RepID=H3ZQ15_THELN|nr:hypothetical protein OCC_02967 [Thermococcus litoralis DSM 5473]
MNLEVSEFNGFYISAIEAEGATLDELKKLLDEHFVLYKYIEDEQMLIAIGTYITEDQFFKEEIQIEAWEAGGDLIVRMYSLNKEFLTYFLEHIKKRLECEGDE